MNLSEIEVVAGELLEQKKRLANAEAELARVRLELKEQPRRSEKDRQFYSLIGLDYQEPSQSKAREDQLLGDRADADAAVRRARETLLSGFSSPDLVIPLDPAPLEEGKRYTFRYRFNASYPRTMAVLSDLLGLPEPITVDEVEIWPDRVSVGEVDAYFAKKKIVDAFAKIRVTVALKLGPRPQ